jgi:hypothetical protein
VGPQVASRLAARYAYGSWSIRRPHGLRYFERLDSACKRMEGTALYLQKLNDARFRKERDICVCCLWATASAKYCTWEGVLLTRDGADSQVSVTICRAAKEKIVSKLTEQFTSLCAPFASFNALFGCLKTPETFNIGIRAREESRNFLKQC